MEPALISGFCSVKRSLTPPGWDTNPLQVLIYLSRKDGKLSWLRHTESAQILAELGIEMGTLLQAISKFQPTEIQKQKWY